MKRRRYIGGVMLAIGIVFFLVVVGAGTFNIAEAFTTLWPLILINIGTEMLFDQKSKMIYLLRVVSVFIFIAYVLFWPMMGLTHIESATAKPLEYTNSYKSSGHQDIAAREDENNIPISATLNINDYVLNADIKGDQTTDLSNADSYYEDSSPGGDWILYEIGEIKSLAGESPAELLLSDDQNWDINAKVYRYNGDIDVRNLVVNGIYVESYYSDLDLIFSEEAKTVVKVDGVTSKIKLHVPRELGIQITCDALNCNMPHDFELVDGEAQNEAFAQKGGIILNVEAVNAEIDIEYTN